MVLNTQPSSKKFFSQLSGATGPKLMILKIIKMRPVPISIKNTFLEVVDCFLADGHLNICILVL